MTDTTYPGYKQVGIDCNLYDHRLLSREALDTGYALASYVFYWNVQSQGETEPCQ